MAAEGEGGGRELGRGVEVIASGGIVGVGLNVVMVAHFKLKLLLLLLPLLLEKDCEKLGAGE